MERHLVHGYHEERRRVNGAYEKDRECGADTPMCAERDSKGRAGRLEIEVYIAQQSINVPTRNLVERRKSRYNEWTGTINQGFLETTQSRFDIGR
jgi:hypothetical protein